MTPKQKRVLEYIEQYWDDYGYAPSFDDIAEYMGYASKNSVTFMLNSLIRRGYVSKITNAHRSVRSLRRDLRQGKIIPK